MLRITKIFKNWLILTAILSLAIIISGCIFIIRAFTPSVKNAEKYEKYKIYDYHLVCDDVKSGYSSAVDRDDIDTAGIKRYRKFKSVSSKQFICLEKSMLLDTSPEKIVLQNPDNYVDVFNEWTVERIDFIDKKGNVIGTLTDQSVIENFKEFINSEKTSQELTEPWSYHDVKNYRVRIYYEESENMQWETAIQHYTSYRYGDYFYVQQINPETGDDSYASISNYPEIYNWLSSCFTSLDAD